MRYAPALALLLAASCSSETPSTAPDAAQGADVAEAGAADATPDRAAPVDASADDRPDVWIWTDPVPLPVDVVDAAVGFDAADAVAVGDAAPDDAADAAVGDAADVAVAVDAPDVVVGPDVVDAGAAAPDVVVADRPDVVDVVRDTGPADAGPVTYDLNAVRASLSAHFAGLQTLPPPTSESRVCPDDPRELTCMVTGATVNFSVRACHGVTLTGLLRLGDTEASTVSIFGGGGGSFARTLRVAAGPVAGSRQSLLVQFAAPPFQSEVGFSGVPGRTVDPALADLWLLGCEHR